MFQPHKKPAELPLTEQARGVKEYLLAQIFRNELPEGARIVEQEIKEQTGTTYLAVRQALMALAKEGILERRRRLGTFVSLKKPASRPGPFSITKLGLLTSLQKETLESGRYTSQVLQGVQEAMEAPREAVYYANSSPGHFDIGNIPVLKPDELLGAVQGVISIEANNAPALNDLVRAGIPLVAVDYVTPQALYDAVVVDHREAGYLVTSHLLAMGHRRIGFIGESPNMHSSDPTWQDRLSGYMHAMAEVAGSQGQFWMLDVRRNADLIGGLLPAFQRQYNLTAYVLCSGGMRDDALAALGSMGLKVPGDVSLVAADAAKKSFPGGNMTCIKVNYVELGRLAVWTLGSRLNCRAMPPVRVTVPVFLSQGQSSESVRPATA